MLTTVLALFLILFGAGSLVLALLGFVGWWHSPAPTVSRIPCPGCGTVVEVDRDRTEWLACFGCGYVLVNKGGATGPAPKWAGPDALTRPATIRPPKLDGPPSSRRAARAPDADGNEKGGAR